MAVALKLCTHPGCLNPRVRYERTCFEHIDMVELDAAVSSTEGETRAARVARKEQDVAKTELKCACGRPFIYQGAFDRHKTNCDKAKPKPVAIITTVAKSPPKPAPRKVARRVERPIRARLILGHDLPDHRAAFLDELRTKRDKLNELISAVEAVA